MAEGNGSYYSRAPKQLYHHEIFPFVAAEKRTRMRPEWYRSTLNNPKRRPSDACVHFSHAASTIKLVSSPLGPTLARCPSPPPLLSFHTHVATPMWFSYQLSYVRQLSPGQACCCGRWIFQRRGKDHAQNVEPLALIHNKRLPKGDNGLYHVGIPKEQTTVPS